MLKSIKNIALKFKLFLLAFTLLAFGQVTAQNFKLLRFEENYEFLKDSSRNFYENVKFLPISKNKEVYVSFGGEARYEFMDFNNEDWGRQNIGHNTFLLQRYDFQADVHFGENFRVFAQIRTALEDGRKNGPRGIDEDQLNIQNLFLDINLWKNSENQLIFRAGRQELDYGSGRLISVQEIPNVRIYFNGGKLMYSSSKFSIDGFAMKEDEVETGIFDNKMSKQLNLWGIYSKTKFSKTGNIDLYYLGIRRNDAVFEEGISKEKRHTIGTRIWKNNGGFLYNFELAYQFGSFGNGAIAAWTGSIDMGYSFKNVKFKPSINLKSDYVSGDKNNDDGNLQTFNPLFPRGGYFGSNPQVGPVNLIDLHPYATMELLSNLTFQTDAIFNWRYSRNDGVYRPSGQFYIAGNDSEKRYIGTSFLANLTYNFNKHFAFTSGIHYFKTGEFLNEVIPNSKDGMFVNSRLTLKF